MIDDKKIKDVREGIFEDKFLFNGTEVIFNDDDEYKEEMYDSGQIKEAISLGAKWAINELLKDLWHDVFEERIPRNKKVIVEYTSEGGMYYQSIKLPDDIHWARDFFDGKRLRRWLYVDDLFPKEGR